MFLPSFDTVLIASSMYYLTFKEHFTYLHKKSHFEIYGLLYPAVSVNEVTLLHKNPTSNKCKCQLSF